MFRPDSKLFQQGLVIGSIEAPFSLLQKPVEILGLDAVELAQVLLRLVEASLAPGDEIRGQLHPALEEAMR